MLASALQRNMSFTEDRKRQHTPGTANRPKQFRKAADMDNAPICINTVLWNTIKLLFPKHAANAPESPADAILTPSSANNAALVANAVAALPMRRIGLIHAPFNPPRRVHAHDPQQRLPSGPQRAPPSWLEGATRDSDPPASGQRHRLALSSQQQTLPQALGRWPSHAGRVQPGGSNHDRMLQQAPAASAAEDHQPSQNHAGVMQRTRSAHVNR
ncbi:hypothetical protein ABBQ38_010506 [Trebouxia sp. C0009 RCD-2024]